MCCPAFLQDRRGKGNVLPLNDLMIAAAAIEQGYAVLTGNLRHFQMVPGLTVVPV
jgi:predicted nucleic acid-binding protein